VLAQTANAFATSQEYLIPQSAINGIFNLCASSTQSAIADN
jgi:hypothetical protein